MFNMFVFSNSDSRVRTLWKHYLSICESHLYFIFLNNPEIYFRSIITIFTHTNKINNNNPHYKCLLPSLPLDICFFFSIPLFIADENLVSCVLCSDFSKLECHHFGMKYQGSLGVMFVMPSNLPHLLSFSKQFEIMIINRHHFDLIPMLL